MPHRTYLIDDLLATGVQPFDDLDAEMIDNMANSLGKTNPVLVPVVITTEGVLVDGHQRLTAMRRAGRTTIDAADVRVVEGNPLEWAVRLNVQRRHLTVEEKAATARRLKAEHGWTQTKIARLFGVSQPAVSQWLNEGKAAPAPKPRKPRGKAAPTSAVLDESKRYAAELINPDLSQWISAHCPEDDREAVAALWNEIAQAAAFIAERVAS
jgi:ParB-like chromosome segregation protein Spo0J